ncbi:MAG: HIT domain-containing protein [Candidatus Omnitrophica bacterium]|nr:HIT domain-containing protein [Candidatus Omnitrophota bacterium]
MDRLWAPWRINYVSGNKPQGHGLASSSQSQNKGKGCIFCRAKRLANRGLALGDYVIFKSKHTIVMLNIYPYNNGHLLVSPLRHIRDISQLRQEEILDLFKSLNRAKALLQKTLKPQGYNIGLNLTRTAGAGIAGHLHMHIVPRWTGDTNFMPVISNTKVISQSLVELTRCLKNADK